MEIDMKDLDNKIYTAAGAFYKMGSRDTIINALALSDRKYQKSKIIQKFIDDLAEIEQSVTDGDIIKNLVEGVYKVRQGKNWDGNINPNLNFPKE